MKYALVLLPARPRRVLALVGHAFQLQYICTSPFIKPEPGVAEARKEKISRYESSGAGGSGSV